jgi:hypothetical protein
VAAAMVRNFEKSFIFLLGRWTARSRAAGLMWPRR